MEDLHAIVVVELNSNIVGSSLAKNIVICSNLGDHVILPLFRAPFYFRLTRVPACGSHEAFVRSGKRAKAWVASSEKREARAEMKVTCQKTSKRECCIEFLYFRRRELIFKELEVIKANHAVI